MRLVPLSQLDSNNPGTWPIYYKVIAWIIMIIGMLILFNQLINTKLDEQITANNTKIKTAQDQYKQLYQYTLDLQQYQERSNELIKELDGLLAYLPLQKQMPELIDNAYKAASDTGISLDGFTPVTELQSQEYYDVAPISLKATTYFENFAKFTESLTRLERIMNISDFSLNIHTENNSKDKNTSKYLDNALDITAQLQTYIYNQDIEKLRNGDLSDYETKNVPKK